MPSMDLRLDHWPEYEQKDTKDIRRTWILQDLQSLHDHISVYFTFSLVGEETSWTCWSHDSLNMCNSVVNSM